MKKITLSLLLVFMAFISKASVIYVNHAASGANNGTSWFDAFTDLQAALTVAVGNDEIWVAQGTYYPGASANNTASFVLKDNVRVYAGFFGNEISLSQRNINSFPATLSGDLDQSGTFNANDAYHVVNIGNATFTAQLDGFHIVGGNAGGAESDGGGIYAAPTGSNTGPSFIDCKIHDNYAASMGGGVAYNTIAASGPLAGSFTGCHFYNNNAGIYGGAVYVTGASSQNCATAFYGCLFYTNTAVAGGNHLDADTDGSGSLSVMIKGCTFAGNPSGSELEFSENGSGVSTVTIYNSILYLQDLFSDAAFDGTNNCGYSAAYFYGANNTIFNPQFINAASNDYRINCNSPAVDIGSVVQAYGPYIGSGPDLGYYEYAPPAITGNASPGTTLCFGDMLTLTGSGAAVSYAWSGAASNGIPFTPSTSTTYTVTGTDSYGCTNTATVPIIINSLPFVTASASPSSTICDGDSVSFYGGGAVSYSWTGSVTNGTPFSPTITDTYTVTGTDVNGCVATETITVTVDASETLSGTMNVGAGVLTDGVMYVFKFHPQQLAFDTMFVYPFSAGTGAYSFPSLQHGDYLIKVIPDTTLFPNLLPTYYGDAFQWDSATVITHNCTNPFVADINMIALLGGTGSGTISGFIKEGTGFGTRLLSGHDQIFAPGGPLKGVDVKLGKNPGGGIQARTMSDTTGHYQFDHLPNDSYRIYVDIPGLPMDSFYVVNIDATVDSLVNLDYYADSNSVFPILPTAVGLHEYANTTNSFDVYPNPAHSTTSVKFELMTEHTASIRVMDITGKQVMNILLNKLPKGKHEYQLNFANQQLSSGVYFIQVMSDTGMQVKKLIIE